MTKQYITAEFWIECSVCEHQEVVTESVPGGPIFATTKSEAWRAAKEIGWTGSSRKPVCGECTIEEPGE